MIKSFFLPLLLIGVATALVFMHTLPQYEILKQKLSEESAYKNALAQAGEILSLKDTLRMQYDSFTHEHRTKLHKLLPDKPDAIGSILEVDDIAARNGVAVTSVGDAPEPRTQSGVAPVDDLRTARISYSMVSNYDNFVSFLTELGRSLRVTDVSSLSFSTANEPGVSDLIDFSLETSTYWLSE